MDMQMGMARALGNSQAICESKLIILGRINRDSSLSSGCDVARAQHSCVYLQEREYAIWSGADPPTSSNDVHAAPAK